MLVQTMLVSAYSDYRYSQSSLTAVTECEQGDRVWVESYSTAYVQVITSGYMYKVFPGSRCSTISC